MPPWCFASKPERSYAMPRTTIHRSPRLSCAVTSVMVTRESGALCGGGEGVEAAAAATAMAPLVEAAAAFAFAVLGRLGRVGGHGVADVRVHRDLDGAAEHLTKLRGGVAVSQSVTFRPASSRIIVVF